MANRLARGHGKHRAGPPKPARYLSEKQEATVGKLAEAHGFKGSRPWFVKWIDKKGVAAVLFKKAGGGWDFVRISKAGTKLG